MTTPVKLRGHHLHCVLTYVGHGYTEAFSEIMARLVEQINAGSPVEIVVGLDDICAALHCGDNGDYKDSSHCFNATVTDRDVKAIADLVTFFQRPINTGTILNYDAETVAKLRQAFVDGKIRMACKGCEWFDVCSGIAACGFDGVKLHPAK